MKKILLLFVSFICSLGVWASTESDLTAITADYQYTPTAALTSATLYDDSHILSLGGSSYSEKKGSVDVGESSLPCVCQIKSNRQIALKIACNATITVYGNSDSSRTWRLGTSNAGNEIAESDGGASSLSGSVKASTTSPVTVYVNASADLYLATLIVTVDNEAPTSNSVAFYDWSSSVGTTELAGTTETGSVNLNNNKTAVSAIKFANSLYSGTDLTNYVKIAPAEGSVFVAGDTLHVKVAFNNSIDAKQAKVQLVDYKEQSLWISEQGINGKTSADSPTDQTFILTSNTPYLYLGRNGNTATYITSLSVIGNKTVDHAVTIPPYYSISAATADETMGSVAIVNGGKYTDEGTTVSVKATAKDGYVFVSWTDANNDVVSTSAEYSFNASADLTLSANFKEKELTPSDFALASTSASVVEGKETVVAYTTSSTGKVSASSDSENATVIVDETAKTITVTGVNPGEATITVSQAASDDYAASEDMAINVTVTAAVVDLAQNFTYSQNGSLTFAYDATASREVYEFGGVYDNTVYGTPTTSIKAGKPYIVTAGADLKLTYKSNAEEATSASSYNGFHGVLGNDEIVSGSDYMVFYSGTLYYANEGGTTVPAGRAYFVCNEIPTGVPAATAKAISGFKFGNFSTGINAVTAAIKSDVPVYNVAGQRVNAAVKGGIYVVGGKKIVVK